MVSRSDREAELVKSIEKANRDLALMRDEAVRIADALPWRARPARLHLESLALRLDTVIDGLNQELMAGPDPSSVKLFLRIARRAVKLGLPALALLGAGVAEGAGSDLYQDLRGHVRTCEVALASADHNASDLARHPADATDAADDDSDPSEAEMATGFSGKAAAEIVGITYRQLDYWARTNLIRPELAEPRGSGSRRRYSYRNLLELKLVKSMLDSGIKLESARDAFNFFRAQDPDFSTARLVIADGSATLVSNDAEMIDVVNTHHGLGTFNLNLLMIDGLSGEVGKAVSARSTNTSPRSPDAADRVAEPYAIPDR